MADKKKSPDNNLIVNRRARFDFDIQEKLWAGIELTGSEVRAARDHHVSLRGSYVTVKNNELWLINSSFSLPKTATKTETTVDTRSRKLLVKKSELKNFIEAKEKGLTIVALSMTTRTRYIKVEIATAKGKKRYDKRETIKRRDLEREHGRMLRQAGR